MKIQPNMNILAQCSDNINDLPLLEIIQGKYDLIIINDVENNQLLIIDSININ